jgi:hypothetical protein
MTASGFRFGLPDVNDGRPWSNLEELQLKITLEQGSTIEEAAKQLYRSGTVGAVAEKATKLGLK